MNEVKKGFWEISSNGETIAGQQKQQQRRRRRSLKKQQHLTDSKWIHSGQGNVVDMTEDNHAHPVKLRLPNEQDCNSNCPVQLDVVIASRLSNVSSNDGELPHDTADYQWFLEYGYKDAVLTTSTTTTTSFTADTTTTITTTSMFNTNRRQPPSIFAALNSPGGGGLIHGDLTYEDLARNIDANLAEIDMEDFRSEDINSILALPAMYCGDFQSQNQGEQAASLSGSIMAKFDVFGAESSNSVVSQHELSSTSSTGGDSTDMSVCKSEPLFSPIKDNNHLPAFSVDSLDCDSYDEQELMLTCQTNMNNYTIAFEGSYTKYSDDSDYHEIGGSDTTESTDSWSGQFKLRSSDSVDGSLVQSDFAYTTWSKLKRVNETTNVQELSTFQGSSQSPNTCKSQSLPNLFRKSGILCSDMQISQLNVSTDSEQCVPVYDIQSSQSRTSDSNSSQQSLSLMRLFIQQKANSSGTSSVSHSLSSGTLQQLDFYGNSFSRSGALSSLDERLQNVLSAKLYGSNSSGEIDLSKEDAISRQRNNEKVNNGTKTADATMNALKRRLKSGLSSCKMYGGEALHEDVNLRTVSPLASPIEEEDENEDTQQWSNNYCDESDSSIDAIVDQTMDSEDSDPITVVARNNVRDRNDDELRPVKVMVIKNFKSSFKDSNAEVENMPQNECKTKKRTWIDKVATTTSKGESSQGTQTKLLNDDCSQNNGVAARADVSSLSSGYVSSSRSSADRHNYRRRSSATDRSTKDFTIAKVKTCGTQIPVHVTDEAIQTSFKGEWLDRILANCAKFRVKDRIVQAGCQNSPNDEDENNKTRNLDKESTVYFCYPKYSLPDLGFLRRSSDNKHLELSNMVTSRVPTARCTTSASRGSLTCCAHPRRRQLRPHTCTGLESLKNVDFSHIQDWDSLNVLLPQDVREMLTKLKLKSRNQDTQEVVKSSLNNDDSVKSKSSNKELLEKETPMAATTEDRNVYVYKFDKNVAEMPSSPPPPPPAASRPPPPLPKRSISLPHGEMTSNKGITGEPFVVSKPPLPKGILRRPHAVSDQKQQQQHATKRYSMPEFLALQDRMPNRNLKQQQCNAATIESGCCQSVTVGSNCSSHSRSYNPRCDSSSAATSSSSTDDDNNANSSNILPCHSHFATYCSLHLMQMADIQNYGTICQNCSGCAAAKDSNVTSKMNSVGDNASKLILTETTATTGLEIMKSNDCTDDDDDICGCRLVEIELKSKKMVSFSNNVHVEEEDANTESCCHQHLTESSTMSRIEKQVGDGEISSNVMGDSESDVPPHIFCVSPIRENNGTSLPNFQRINALVLAVNAAVSVLTAHFNQARDHQEKFILGNYMQTPSMGHKVLHHLCPTLYGILNDGLQPAVYNMFGHMDNSVWLVIEAVAQSGNCNKQMSDLVVHVNNEQSLWGKKMKFNAFVFGLLNIRSLDTWFAVFGGCENILKKHYLPDAFMQSTKMSSSKSLFDDLLLSLQTLSMLPFDLDLALESHLTRQSCQWHLISQPSPVHDCNSVINNRILSKSIPESCGGVGATTSHCKPCSSPCSMMSPKILTHRHSCGHFDTSSEFYYPHLTYETQVTVEGCCSQDGFSGGRKLRRGYSQDSAIATGSSDCSNGSTGVGSLGDGDVGFLVCRGHAPMCQSRPVTCCESCVTGRLSSNLRSCNGLETQQQIRRREEEEHEIVSDQVVPKMDSGDGGSSSDGTDTLVAPLPFVGADASDSNISQLHRDSQNNNIKISAEKTNNDDDNDDEDSVHFKELRLKWENMCGTTTNNGEQKKISSPQIQKSKIPRLVTPSSKSNRMEDSSISMRTTSGSLSPECGSSSIRSLVYSTKVDGQQQQQHLESPKRRQLTSAEVSSPQKTVSGCKTNLKVPPTSSSSLSQQPNVVKMSSGVDKSPMRKRPLVTARRRPISPAPKTKQSVSRGVGGGGCSIETVQT